MEYKITKVAKDDYPVIIEIWEASVRSTHHFLTEDDMARLKPLILDQYLDAVELRVARDASDRIRGFLGVADGNLEMLFLHPDQIGQGIGRQLLQYAVDQMEVTKVDVNEQNEGAKGFYLHNGFEVIGRSEKDGQGKPFPILHMQLKNL